MDMFIFVYVYMYIYIHVRKRKRKTKPPIGGLAAPGLALILLGWWTTLAASAVSAGRARRL